MKPKRSGAFLSRLARDTDGATLAIAAASVLAIMGVVGGAIDIGRAYMAQSRLQQACDAGALATRKAMAGETLTNAERDIGYRFFDFNFPANSYGVELTSRTYSQPANQAGTPQAVINGVVVATVPTTIMRIFGKETIDLNITCSSKMDIANADVAMVLDVTGSMTTNMRISSSGTATEDRILALHKAVRAFYTALGPGRAGGDLSKGRIRYAFVPYGVVVNAGHLLTHDQMVDSWNYQSRLAVNGPFYGWTLGTLNTNYGDWSGPPDAYSNDAAYNSFSLVSNSSYTMQDGTTVARRNTSATNTTQCSALNQYGSYNKMVGIEQTEGTPANPTLVTTNQNPPVHPASVQNGTASQTRVADVSYGYRYRYFSNNGTNGCWLERASKKTSGTPGDKYTQTRTGTTTRSISWTQYTGALVYGSRLLDVSGIKGMAGAWNGTITVPGLNTTGTLINNVKLSGSDASHTVFNGGSAQNVTVTWRGCVEERQMDNTITSATSIGTIPTDAFDLNTNMAAISGNDATRWRPWISTAVYDPGDKGLATAGEQCPAPALKLQEIGDYNTTILSTSYPNLFQATSGAPASHYYPHLTSLWGTSSTPAAERTKNSQTIRNYIERITSTLTGLTDGTIHDAGFIWGLHLVSGEGMFAAENPDRFNGQLVSRNIVFMTDGEINPGEERYVYSGFNNYDGRLAPTGTNDDAMKLIHNRRLRILCEAAKRQGITVWVVVISDSTTQDFSDLEACASSRGNYKSAATSEELVASFTTIAQSIGGLRISQ